VGQTVVEKVAQAHAATAARGREFVAGDFLSIQPRHILTHDNTAPAMRIFRAMGGKRLRLPEQAVFVLDHDIQNMSPENLDKYAAIESFARDQGVDFYPAGTGIGHQVMIERGYVQPERFVVAADSHANMYGGVGAVGTPVVRTDAAAIWATGQFWWQIPATVQVVLEGQLPTGATGKDVILALCSLYPRDVLNHAVEFVGNGAASLSVEQRLTIANMTTEWGALTGWFQADARTLAYLGRRAEQLERPLQPDDHAVYAARIRLDLTRIRPWLSGPDSLQRATSVAASQIRIDKAYLVSCVNSRAEDLAAAADVVRGKTIAPHVEFYVAPASREVQSSAEHSGDWQTLLDAGARALPAGCGPCIGLGAGLLKAGEVGISATNRNFKGRMGSRDARCYLASPAVVAAAAVAGHICAPLPCDSAPILAEFTPFEQRSANPAAAQLVDGFPERLEGRAVFLPRDDMNTDLIYPSDRTYRDDMSAAEMSRVVFANHDPTLAARLERGDILIAGRNFGCGSSREQAVTALQAIGIAAVVAAGFSQTYRRNAFNRGFLCLECPELADHAFPDSRSIRIDFVQGRIGLGESALALIPLDALAQRLIVGGGIVNQIRATLD